MGVDKMLPKVSCRELREKPLLRLYLALAVLMLVAMFSATFHHTQLAPERMSSLNQLLLRPPAEFDPAGRRHAIGLLDSRDCEDYNWTRCTDLDRMPVFVYPRNQHEKQPDSWWDSHIYWKAAQRLDDEPQFLVNTTTNPHEACVLISDVNTMCENNQCCGQRKEIVARVRQDSALWDHGRQHFLFNMHDSRPMRIDNAIMLDGGTNLARRRPQDISFALPPRHACCGLDDGITEGQVWDLSRDRKWLLGFKGQRYLHTAVVRFSVRALSAPDEGVMIVSKCMKEEGNFDPWCADDASLYEETDYGQLMFNSTFALVPVGYGLGSYRLIEAMSFGCVPVVLSDGYELPLDELLDWTEFTVIVPEKSWSAVPTILRSISFERLMRMKRRVHEVYWQYFATRERMLAGAIEVLRRRLTALQPVCR